ncbi:MAG: choice-of-anchor Q domain-containing protein [Chloroflexota bacterium]
MKLVRLFITLGLAFGLLAVSPAEPVHADTVSVSNCDDSGAGSLRQTINDANIGDTVNFSVDCPASAPITLTSSIIISKALTVSGAGHDVVISGGNAIRILEIMGADATLEYLTLKEASVSDGGDGGAIYDSGNHLTISHVTFESNIVSNAGDGGAIYHYLNGSLTIQNSTFTANSANLGGAIFSMAATTSTDTTFSNNKAYRGGAYTNYSGTTSTFERVTMSGNTAIGPGSTFGSGGAIYFGFGTLNLYNSTLSGNGSSEYTSYGGAVYTYNSTVTIKNSTIADNMISAADSTFVGGGLLINDATLNLSNTILANNTKDDCFTESGLTVAQNVGNLVEVSVGCGTPSLTADPNLGPLADNGGSTWTRALLPGSPAIDAGDTASCLASDQRGIVRPQGSFCDVGAYEFPMSKMTFRSVGAHDGWILESGENTTVGGTLDSTSTTFNLGDGTADRQYRAILSFNTTTLPDNAVITKATLRIRKQAPVGTDPFTILGGLKVDMRKPSFGAIGLTVTDFQTAAGRVGIATFGATPVNNWYSAMLNAAGRNYLNKTGTTQFRLYFAKDDNDDNGADYMKFFSGNYATASARPTLIIEYYVP